MAAALFQYVNFNVFDHEANKMKVAEFNDFRWTTKWWHQLLTLLTLPSNSKSYSNMRYVPRLNKLLNLLS